MPVIAYWPDGIYCHLPDNRIFRIARDGSSMVLFAQLPAAALRRRPRLRLDGQVRVRAPCGDRRVGVERRRRLRDPPGRPRPARRRLPGPRRRRRDRDGTEGVRHGLRPLLLSIDQDSVTGRVLAIDRKGSTQVVASGLGNGDNPIAAIPPAPKYPAGRLTAAGLYVPNTNTMDVYFARRGAAAPYAGQVLVGTELQGNFWLIRPTANGLRHRAGRSRSFRPATSTSRARRTSLVSDPRSSQVREKASRCLTPLSVCRRGA